MNEELQSKCINRILKENIEFLNSRELKNKISYNLIKEDETMVNEIKILSNLYKIADRALLMNNYKKAFRYSCMLKSRINKVKNMIK
ncbi:MAG: hypothetical protein ACRC2K_06825 [Clostridium sp.]